VALILGGVSYFNGRGSVVVEQFPLIINWSIPKVRVVTILRQGKIKRPKSKSQQPGSDGFHLILRGALHTLKLLNAPATEKSRV